jgi:hypothetical protein
VAIYLKQESLKAGAPLHKTEMIMVQLKVSELLAF